MGDAVAIVLAETEAQARDASYAVDVTYDTLGVVVNAREAIEDGAPLVHDDVPNNLCFHWTVSGGEVDAAFEQADVVVGETIINQRLIPNAMEPRAVLARWDSAMGEVTLWTTSQIPHITRFLLSLTTPVPEHKIRVIAPDVGGGFGSKLANYPEENMSVFAAQQLGIPVKWTETRSENYLGTIHGAESDGPASDGTLCRPPSPVRASHPPRARRGAGAWPPSRGEAPVVSDQHPTMPIDSKALE